MERKIFDKESIDQVALDAEEKRILTLHEKSNLDESLAMVIQDTRFMPSERRSFLKAVQFLNDVTLAGSDVNITDFTRSLLDNLIKERLNKTSPKDPKQA